MKRLILLIILFTSFASGYSQVDEKLSPEEKARREKNIQAGNPFKKLGYYPKIATLSKGKYLEFHDLDSIVRIGSFTFNTNTMSVINYVRLDTVHSEATLRPELISRWFSTDPLSDEYPSWSPYNFVYNNPINFIDKDGREGEWHWEGDSLVSDEGDTTESLGEFLSINSSVAKQLVADEHFLTYSSNTQNGLANTIVGGQEAYTVDRNTPVSRFVNMNSNIKTYNGDHVTFKFDSGGNYSNSYHTEGYKAVSDAFDVANWMMDVLFYEHSIPQGMRNGFKGNRYSSRRLSSISSNTNLKSFDDLAMNPKSIWGKNANEVGNVLGKGWEKQNLNSGNGWKFIQKGGDGFVSFTTGNSHHPGSSYYKISSGRYGKIKVVGSNYVRTSNEKSNIIIINE